jgi:hypothetical protein
MKTLIILSILIVGCITQPETTNQTEFDQNTPTIDTADTLRQIVIEVKNQNINQYSDISGDWEIVEDNRYITITNFKIEEIYDNSLCGYFGATNTIGEKAEFKYCYKNDTLTVWDSGDEYELVRAE